MKHPFNKALLAAAFFCAFPVYCSHTNVMAAQEEMEDAALNQDGVYRKTGTYDSLTVTNLLVKNIEGNNGSPVLVSGGINTVNGSVMTNGISLGIAGPAGPAGAAGATGPAGNVLGYAYMHNTAGSTVTPVTIIPLASGTFSPTMSAGLNGIKVTNGGTFVVEFYVQGTTGTTGTQMSASISVDGALQATTIYAGNVLTAGQYVVGRAILDAAAGQTITIVNTSEQAAMAGGDSIILAANTNTSTGGSIINASLVVLQIA